MMNDINATGIKKDNTFQEYYMPYTFNCDAHLLAKIDWCFEVVQEIAGYHSSILNCAIPDLHKNGLTWVISREHMEIIQYPKWREKILVKTWAEEAYRRILLPRIVEGRNENGELLFKASTLWAVLNLKTGRPTNPNAIIEKIGVPPVSKEKKFHISKREVYNDDYPVIGSSKPKIYYSDTDVNKHANNISYIRWLLQSLPNSFRDKNYIKDIDASWLKQTFIKDKIKMITNSENPLALEEKSPILYHKLVRTNKDGTEEIVFEAKSLWEGRD